ncbi:MAG: hypothetical protein H6935_12610 [Thiobacillus sp.]|nr:hypothetical protein [Thiobacillus sp.]
MSKLEDKLAASIKPGKAAPTAPTKRAVAPKAEKVTTEKASTAPVMRPARTAAAKVTPSDTTAAASPAPTSSILHPRRVWPD